MFDDTTQRLCPHCENAINWAATRCGYCWHTVEPLSQAEAVAAAVPYSNHSEALRLVRERDSAGIEALLDERDRLREELQAGLGNGAPAAAGAPRGPEG